MMKKLLNNLHPNLINYELNLVILLPYMISSKKENFIMKKNMYLDITIEIIINTEIILIEIDIDKTNSMNFPTMMIAKAKITIVMLKVEEILNIIIRRLHIIMKKKVIAITIRIVGMAIIEKIIISIKKIIFFNRILII